MLCDAVESIRVGSAWDLPTRMGPLIRPPSGELLRSLTVLEPGESWAVQPRPDATNPNLWSPGIKYGVQPGSFTHLTEFFGPLLGVMRYERIEDAIALVNATGYGLTSGIQSLDERETMLWQDSIRAGNLYICDIKNNTIWFLNRDDGKIAGRLGSMGEGGGQFFGLHMIAVDSQGQVYTGEVFNGERVQRFVPADSPRGKLLDQLARIAN